MKISVFEYAYAFDDKNFIVEGKAMLNLIVKGLKKENIKVNKIKLKDKKNYKEEILNYVENTDFTILIAPNYELLSICKFLYEKNLYEKILISPIDSIENTLNKWKLYRKINKEILMPKTEIFNDPDINFDFPFILKPIYGTGCEDIYLFENYEKFKEISKKFNSNFIIQEFIDGIHCSVSLFCSKEIFPASLNLQRIKFLNYKGLRKLEYKGGIVPFDIDCKITRDLKEKIFEISKKACKILNLKGYIGIDFVIKDKIYLIEI
ncbi:MAG: ATP-grasp domain-containing protein, partial [Candidatus Altarchaeaceae archaeon]